MSDEPIEADPWRALRRFTGARIGLGRAGDSLPTAALLRFQLDHARARDAVHQPFEPQTIAAQLLARGHETLILSSAAASRADYLRRPDLGRRLSDESRAELQLAAAGAGEYDAAFVVADGLSAQAAHAHAAELLAMAAAELAAAGWRVAPVTLVRQGRVAVGDEVGELLRAAMVAVLIGERPGLSAADSLGVYLTYAPRPGRSDAERNCISNIHAQGLSYAAACRTLVYLMAEARRRRLSGVMLKDDRADNELAELPAARAADTIEGEP